MIQLPATNIFLAYVDTLTVVFKLACAPLLPDGIVAMSCSFRDFIVVDVTCTLTLRLAVLYPSRAQECNSNMTFFWKVHQDRMCTQDFVVPPLTMWYTTLIDFFSELSLWKFHEVREWNREQNIGKYNRRYFHL